MNIQSIIVLALIVSAIAAAVYQAHKSKHIGCGGCCGNCSECKSADKN